MKQLKFFIIILIFCALIVSMKYAIAQIPHQASDAAILSLISIIDQNEIRTAELARQKNIDPKVLDYAQMLDTEHSQHLIMAQKIAQQLNLTLADNSPVIVRIRNKGQEDIAALMRLNGDAFAQLYIADMIKGHSDVLDWIDSEDSQNEQMMDFLKETRKHIVMHLDKALEIQKHQKIGQA